MTRDRKHTGTRAIALDFEDNGKLVRIFLELQGGNHAVSDLQFAEGFDDLPADVQSLIIRAHMPIEGEVPLHYDAPLPTYCSGSN